jgi:methylenetetrahydrofolate reductase (NADPH)
MKENISNLQKSLKEGKFVFTSEFASPKGVDTALIEEKVGLLKESVVAVNVSDLQGANLSMDGLATSSILIDSGLEPVLQLTCRDRNRLALQSNVLSASVMGIKSILVLTGDHTTVGDHPSSYPVFDLDSVQLLWAISRLEEGYDMAGNKLSKKPTFFKGAAVNPGANSEASYELQLMKMKKKVDCGAEFFQTMPVFDPERFIEFIKRVKEMDIDVHILAGIQLLKSERMANYLNKYLPGIIVPQMAIDRLAGASDKLAVSLDIAADTVNKIKPYCSGIHIGAQGWEEHIPALIKNIDKN